MERENLQELARLTYEGWVVLGLNETDIDYMLSCLLRGANRANYLDIRRRRFIEEKP